MSEPLPALLPTSLVYGSETPELDDPAEVFHEASKLHPSLRGRQAAGIVRLGLDATLQAASAGAASRGNRQRRRVALPPADRARVPRRGHSPSEFPQRALAVDTLATVLQAGYGVTADGRRAVPSGGALYPLELYPAVRHARGLKEGVYHYEPAGHALELVRVGAVGDELEAICTLDGLLRNVAVVVFIAAVFWRTRFKYGLRGYRFALLEAGHCAQNVLIAAHASGVPALPLGGYYDSRAERLVGVDGVEEAVVYAVALGGDT